jgi:signal transduction histidine kinase
VTTPNSLENHMRKLAMKWTMAGLSLTLGLSLSIIYWLPFRDAENQITEFSKAAITSHRVDLLSGGDIRAIELHIQKELGLSKNESVIFLDANKKPWLNNFRAEKIKPCAEVGGVCRNLFEKRVVAYTPIYFGKDKDSIWGYLYIDKTPATYWPMVISVTLAIIIGMAFQSIGFYYNLTRAIKSVGLTLKDWARRLSVNPKNRDNYDDIPFSEIAPIEAALVGLRAEIDQLEEIAREEGALSTLRSVGHDILNPVARMKRTLGVVEAEGKLNAPLDSELYQSLQSNIARLSCYAEQLKFLYMQQIGEGPKQSSITDISVEVKNLISEMQSDPYVKSRRISLVSNVGAKSFVGIPAATVGRLIENLCSNAVQASHPGGQVTIEANTTSDRTIFSITDYGKGIDDTIKDKIFDVGFTTRPNQGTGLGLFVVKRICEQYGGSLALISELGRGTKISIEFPRVEVGYESQNFVG